MQEPWRRAPSSKSCEQISAVITNKFSTRNEVRKRERVNPKVRPKGVRSYFWYLADGKPGGANKAPERNGCCGGSDEGETERKRGTAPFSIEKSDGWKQLKIRDVFSIPCRDIRNYCLCFSSSTAVFIPLKPDPPPTVPMSYLSNSSSQPQPSFFWSLNPNEDTSDSRSLPRAWHFVRGGSSPLLRFLPLTLILIATWVRGWKRGRLLFERVMGWSEDEAKMLSIRCIWFIGVNTFSEFPIEPWTISNYSFEIVSEFS